MVPISLPCPVPAALSTGRPRSPAVEADAMASVPAASALPPALPHPLARVAANSWRTRLFVRNAEEHPDIEAGRAHDPVVAAPSTPGTAAVRRAVVNSWNKLPASARTAMKVFGIAAAQGIIAGGAYAGWRADEAYQTVKPGFPDPRWEGKNRDNNCYTYALDLPNEKPRLYGLHYSSITCENIRAAVELDGVIVLGDRVDCNFDCPEGYHAMTGHTTLETDPEKGADYHWYRRDEWGANPGYWSQKHGRNLVENVDASGSLITCPFDANHDYRYPTLRLNYQVSCGAFCAPDARASST